MSQLNPESLEVTSFFASAEPSAASVGGGISGPHCIVYISDCVSCFPDPMAVSQ